MIEMIEKLKSYRKTFAYLFWINFDKDRFIKNRITDFIKESDNKISSQKRVNF